MQMIRAIFVRFMSLFQLSLMARRVVPPPFSWDVVAPELAPM